MKSRKLAPLPLTRCVFWILVCLLALSAYVNSTAQLKVLELPIDQLRGYTHQASDGSIWRSGRSGTWRLHTENRTWESISQSQAILIDPPYIICHDVTTDTYRTSFDSGKTFVEDRPKRNYLGGRMTILDNVMFTFDHDQILGSSDSGVTWNVYADAPHVLIGIVGAVYRRGSYLIAHYEDWVHDRYTAVVFRKQSDSLIPLFEGSYSNSEATPLNISAVAFTNGLYEIDESNDSLRQIITMDSPRMTVDVSGRYTAVGSHNDKGFICTKASNNSLWKIDTVDISNIVGAQSVFVDNDTVIILSSRTERVSTNGGKTFTSILRNTGDQWQHIVSTPTGVVLYDNRDAVVTIDSAGEHLHVRSVRPRQFHAMGWIDTSLVAIEENDYLRLDTLWRTTVFRRLFREMIILGQIRAYNGFLFGQYIVRDDTAFHVSTDDGYTWTTILGFPKLELGENSRTADVIFVQRNDTLWFCGHDLNVYKTSSPPGTGQYTLHVLDNKTYSLRGGYIYELRDNTWQLYGSLDLILGFTLRNTQHGLYGLNSNGLPFRWSPTTGVQILHTSPISASTVSISGPYVVFTDSSRRYLVHKEQTTTSIDHPEQRIRTELPTSIVITDNILDLSLLLPYSFSPPAVTIHAVTGETVLTERDSWIVRTDSIPRGVYVMRITNRDNSSADDVLIMIN